MAKHQLLQSELRPGEVLLWTEEPGALAYLSGDKIYGLIFMIVWLAFVGAAAWGAEIGIISLIMFAFGLFMLGSIVWDVAQSHFTLYGLTESRLLIVRAHPWSQDVESYIDRDIRFLRKTRRKLSGSAVVFTTVPYEGSKGRVHHRDIGFFGIDDADLVEALIEKHFRYREILTRSADSQ